MSEQPILLWLRRDLRLSDLPPLLAAEGRQVLACIVLDPTLEASSGGHRLSFLYDSLRDIEDQLDGKLLVTPRRSSRRSRSQSTPRPCA